MAGTKQDLSKVRLKSSVEKLLSIAALVLPEAKPASRLSSASIRPKEFAFLLGCCPHPHTNPGCFLNNEVGARYFNSPEKQQES